MSSRAFMSPDYGARHANLTRKCGPQITRSAGIAPARRPSRTVSELRGIDDEARLAGKAGLACGGV